MKSLRSDSYAFHSSVNEVICHGIPDSRELQDGDICNGELYHVQDTRLES